MDAKDLVIRPKNPKGDDGHKTFSVRLKNELIDRLNSISTQTGHSRNELIGILLDYALDHCTISEK